MQSSTFPKNYQLASLIEKVLQEPPIPQNSYENDIKTALVNSVTHQPEPVYDVQPSAPFIANNNATPNPVYQPHTFPTVPSYNPSQPPPNNSQWLATNPLYSPNPMAQTPEKIVMPSFYDDLKHTPPQTPTKLQSPVPQPQPSPAKTDAKPPLSPFTNAKIQNTPRGTPKIVKGAKECVRFSIFPKLTSDVSKSAHLSSKCGRISSDPFKIQVVCPEEVRTSNYIVIHMK